MSAIAVEVAILAGLSVLLYAAIVLLVVLTGPHHPAERAEHSRKREPKP